MKRWHCRQPYAYQSTTDWYKKRPEILDSVNAVWQTMIYAI